MYKLITYPITFIYNSINETVKNNLNNSRGTYATATLSRSIYPRNVVNGSFVGRRNLNPAVLVEAHVCDTQSYVVFLRQLFLCQ